MVKAYKCVCGKGEHYLDSDNPTQKMIMDIIEEKGENIVVTQTLTNKKSNIPRIFIAMHGITGTMNLDRIAMDDVHVTK